jgi:chromosome segregation ATPase
MAKHNAAISGNANVPADIASDDNLVDLDSRGDGSMREINRMIDSLEQDIGALELKITNSHRSIRKDIRQLHQSDADIGEQVADIYRQLGLVESRFGELKKDASAIKGRLTRLNKTIDAAREQALVSLADALENQGGVNLELQQAQQDMIARADRLAEKAGALTRKLNKSIKDNSLALSELESRIVSELERVAAQSEQRADAADEQLQQHQAKMLKLQQVDQALDRRASGLESLTRSLLDDSEALQQQTEMLGVVTERLDADLEALQLRTARLDAENRRHRGLIDQLQRSGRELGGQLLALGRREDRRFVVLSLFGLLLLVAVIALFGYDQLQRIDDRLVLDQRAVDTQNQIQDLQTRVLDEQVATRRFDHDIAALEQQVAQVRRRLVTVDDQLASLDGRVSHIAPLRGFGGDNVIHGSQWLSELDPERYSIRLARVDDKAEMYDIVQRYNHYLPLTLGYYPDPRGGYTLVYGGAFADAGEVEEALRWMPRYFNHQPAEVIANREILAAISR